MPDRSDDVVRPLRKGDPLKEGYIAAPPYVSRRRVLIRVFIAILVLVGTYLVLHEVGGDQVAAAFLLGWALHGLVVRK